MKLHTQLPPGEQSALKHAQPLPEKGAGVSLSTVSQSERILEELAAGELTQMERKVFDLLHSNPQGLTRYQLLEELYGLECAQHAKIRGLANSGADRKVRATISSLREMGFCIVSSSGESGYRLDATPETVRAMVNEWQSRVNCLTDHIQRIIITNDPQPRTAPEPGGPLGMGGR